MLLQHGKTLLTFHAHHNAELEIRSKKILPKKQLVFAKIFSMFPLNFLVKQDKKEEISKNILQIIILTLFFNILTIVILLHQEKEIFCMWTTIHFKVCRGSENEILWLFSEQITDQGGKNTKKNIFFTGFSIQQCYIHDN